QTRCRSVSARTTSAILPGAGRKTASFSSSDLQVDFLQLTTHPLHRADTDSCRHQPLNKISHIELRGQCDPLLSVRLNRELFKHSSRLLPVGELQPELL